MALYKCGGDTKYKKLYEQEVSAYNTLNSQYNSLQSSYNNLQTNYNNLANSRANSKLKYSTKDYAGTDSTYASSSLVNVELTNSSFNMVTTISIVFKALNSDQTHSRNMQVLVNGSWQSASSYGPIANQTVGGTGVNNLWTWVNTTGAKVTGVRALGVCNETTYGGCSICMSGYSN